MIKTFILSLALGISVMIAPHASQACQSLAGTAWSIDYELGSILVEFSADGSSAIWIGPTGKVKVRWAAGDCWFNYGGGYFGTFIDNGDGTGYYVETAPDGSTTTAPMTQSQ